MALPNLSRLVQTAPIPTGMPLTSDKDWLEGMEAKRTFAQFRSLEAMEEHADRLNAAVDWIEANATERDIQLVVILGDIFLATLFIATFFEAS